MSDTVDLRSNERSQLLELLPEAAERFEGYELQSEADAIRDDIIPTVEDGESLDSDQCDVVVRGLLDLDDSRSQWLRAKIARRDRQHAMKMGFTTWFPIGYTMAQRSRSKGTGIFN